MPARSTFAYGANMHAEDLRGIAPGVELLGIATLPDWRIGVTSSGWLGVEPMPGEVVHGAVFGLGKGDEPLIDAFEAVDRGLYHKAMIEVNASHGPEETLVYVPNEPLDGKIRETYLERCIQAAIELGLPEAWREHLRGFRPSA